MDYLFVSAWSMSPRPTVPVNYVARRDLCIGNAEGSDPACGGINVHSVAGCKEPYEVPLLAASRNRVGFVSGQTPKHAARKFLFRFMADYAAALVLMYLIREHIHRRYLDKAFCACSHVTFSFYLSAPVFGCGFWIATRAIAIISISAARSAPHREE